MDYSSDLNGNRTKTSLNAATIATYRYDVVDRLTKLFDEAGAATTYTYDAAGRPISRRLPNGVVTTEEYDGLDRLARLKHVKGATVIANTEYQYNAASQISQIAEPATTRSFAYDPTDRLTSMTSPTLPGENYAYDSVGNRTSSHLSASYTHQPVNKLTQTSTATYSYDNNGNLISKTDSTGTWTYTWDFENRLKQVTRPDGVTVSYKYDALGRRIQRAPSNGVSTNYIYDGEDVVLDQNSDGSTVRYLNGPGIDNKLRQTSNAGALYFMQDHLGSTRALTNANGTIVEQLTYDSFGNGASNRSRYGYTGREWDGDAGLYHYRNRWYDPQVGRFISEDPIGLSGGINPYAYVGNSPTHFVDPMGLDIAIVENHGTTGNPIGHTAIAITNRGVISFGNARGQGTDKENILSGSLERYIRRELPDRDTTILIIKTTPEQDAAIFERLWWIELFAPQLTEGSNSILIDNCSSRVNNALDVGGIAAGRLPYIISGSAGLRAVSDDGFEGKIEIPRNSNLSPEVLKVLKRFEPNFGPRGGVGSLENATPATTRPRRQRPFRY